MTDDAPAIVNLLDLLAGARKRKPQGRPLALGTLPEERPKYKRWVSKKAADKKAAEAEAEAIAEALDPGPQLVCSHWTRRQDQRHWSPASSHAALIVVDDCEEARTEAYWRARTPEGSRLTVTLWSGGYGCEGDRYEVALDGGDDNAPPPADSMPARVPVELRDGSTRPAVFRNGTYVLQLRPGEEVVQREVAPPPPPRDLGTGSRARARARVDAKKALETKRRAAVEVEAPAWAAPAEGVS